MWVAQPAMREMASVKMRLCALSYGQFHGDGFSPHLEMDKWRRYIKTNCFVKKVDAGSVYVL